MISFLACHECKTNEVFFIPIRGLCDTSSLQERSVALRRALRRVQAFANALDERFGSEPRQREALRNRVAVNNDHAFQSIIVPDLSFIVEGKNRERSGGGWWWWRRLLFLFNYSFFTGIMRYLQMNLLTSTRTTCCGGCANSPRPARWCYSVTLIATTRESRSALRCCRASALNRVRKKKKKKK